MRLSLRTLHTHASFFFFFYFQACLHTNTHKKYTKTRQKLYQGAFEILKKKRQHSWKDMGHSKDRWKWSWIFKKKISLDLCPNISSTFISPSSFFFLFSPTHTHCYLHVVSYLSSTGQMFREETKMSTNVPWTSCNRYSTVSCDTEWESQEKKHLSTDVSTCDNTINSIELNLPLQSVTNLVNSPMKG